MIEKLKMKKFGKEKYSTFRFKGGGKKEFTIENGESGWWIYTKAKNGSWKGLKKFSSLLSAERWLGRHILKINMHKPILLKKILSSK